MNAEQNAEKLRRATDLIAQAEALDRAANAKREEARKLLRELRGDLNVQS